MGITNTQYNEILREYDRKQLQNRARTASRLQEVYQICPELKELEEQIVSCSAQKAKAKVMGEDTTVHSCERELVLLKQKKEELLSTLPLPADYLQPVYHCVDCKDTGYCGNEKCHCFKQAIINIIYSQSNMKEVLETENFSTFSYEYFSKEIDRETGASPYETIQRAVGTCREFISHFDEKPKNLLFYGNTGVGKTFLSNCVAKEILDNGYSVIYFTAYQIFDILSKGIFEKDSDAIAANQNIFDCDLLIIDDLGTELSNAFTSSQLFLIINERILRKKSTIISTNLNLFQISERYSERSFSRISSNYSFVKLSGEDIRIRKRQMR